MTKIQDIVKAQAESAVQSGLLAFWQAVARQYPAAIVFSQPVLSVGRGSRFSACGSSCRAYGTGSAGGTETEYDLEKPDPAPELLAALEYLRGLHPLAAAAFAECARAAVTLWVGTNGQRDWTTPEKAIAGRLKEMPEGLSSGTNILDHAVTHEQGETCLWWAVETPSLGRLIALDKISNMGDCYGYKPMDETEGPYFHSCPLNLLRLTEPGPMSQMPGLETAMSAGYSAQWRARAYAHHGVVPGQQALAI